MPLFTFTGSSVRKEPQKSPNKRKADQNELTTKSVKIPCQSSSSKGTVRKPFSELSSNLDNAANNKTVSQPSPVKESHPHPSIDSSNKGINRAFLICLQNPTIRFSSSASSLIILSCAVL